MATQQSAESKSERITLAVTPTELRALQVIAAARPEDYEGVSSVVRDYALRDAVNRAIELEKRLAAIGQ